MIKKVIIIFTYTLFFVICAYSQITFTKTYGGNKGEVGYSVQQTPDGGYIIVGELSSISSWSDIYLVKTDSLGDTLWTKEFGQDYCDVGHDIEQTLDGGYVIVGGLGEPQGFIIDICYKDIFIIKTDVNGDTLWTKRWGTSDELDVAYSIRQTQDSNYIICGIMYDNGANDSRAFLAKLNSNGDTLWTKKYDISSSAYSVEPTIDGGFIITGEIGSSSDIYLVKTDSLGDTLWTKIFYGGPLYDAGISVKQTLDSGYIVAGYARFNSNDLTAAYLIKTDINGDTLWTKIFDHPFYDGAYSVVSTADGGYVFTGRTMKTGTGEEVWLIKTNSIGDTLWTKTFGEKKLSHNEIGYSVQQTADLGYIITGSFRGVIGNGMILIKTDSLGIAPPYTGIASLSFEHSTSMIYPNPFTKSTTFEITQDGKNTSYTFKLFDLLGRQVKVIKDITDKAFQVNRGTLSEGMYIYKLYSEEGMIHTGKLLVE